MNVNKILKDLSEATGVAGAEGEAADKAEKYIRPYVDSIKRDSLGNLVAFKQRNLKPRKRYGIFLAAHIDEIGLMVSRIDDNGFMRFTTIGGFDPRTLWGQSVMVHGKKDLRGVIGTKPPHLVTPKDIKKEMLIRDMYIDVGLSGEKVKELVSAGDIISIYREFVQMKDNNYMAGKAFDNRAGILTLIYAAHELQRFKHGADMYLVGTVQEEVGTRGAITSTYEIMPDIGIAVDVCHGDMPGVSSGETYELGKGPVIAVGPNIHPLIAEKLQKTAKEQRIPFSIDPTPGPAPTDARAMQITREGVPTALISVPLRYMHTSVETVHAEDIRNAGRLIASFITDIDEEFMDQIKNYD